MKNLGDVKLAMTLLMQGSATNKDNLRAVLREIGKVKLVVPLTFGN